MHFILRAKSLGVNHITHYMNLVLVYSKKEWLEERPRNAIIKFYLVGVAIVHKHTKQFYGLFIFTMQGHLRGRLFLARFSFASSLPY